MQVGDLVKYRSSTNAALGIVLKTPEQTAHGHFEVCFLKAGHDPHTMYCRHDFLEIINASR
jgi:hypothetical protein